MSHHEVFGDPVVVPGANVRSLFTDTETVDDDTAGLVVAADTRVCPTCHRRFPAFLTGCPHDGTRLSAVPVTDGPATA